MNVRRIRLLAVGFGVLAWLLCGHVVVRAGDLAVLQESNWGDLVPQGKEVDAIYGDYVLRNDRICVVIARPVPTRNANMTVRDVGGAIIDLTLRSPSNDQLSAYYPHAARYDFTEGSVQFVGDGVVQPPDQGAAPLAGWISAKELSLVMTAPAGNGLPEVELKYTVRDGQPFVLVESTLRNRLDAPLNVPLGDSIRADRTFVTGVDESTGLYWAYDEAFGQAYGVLVENARIRPSNQRGVLELERDGQRSVKLEPDAQVVLTRRIFPGRNLLELRAIANQRQRVAQHPLTVEVSDPAGPVARAKVTVKRAGEAGGDETMYGWGRTGQRGRLVARVPEGTCTVTVEALGRPAKSVSLSVAEPTAASVELDACGYVQGKVVDDEGRAVPVKIALWGVEGTPDPDFGPDSQAVVVRNLIYSHNGDFRTELAPGTYDVVLSRGPEYDAVFQRVEVRRGETAQVQATLRRVVDTTGWISADFHSHSSPSGDNTGSQRGRVLNLLCEQIDFAPCTEHNRIDSYMPHLKALQAEHLMGTCPGMELTGGPLPVNHQNAFPLRRTPRSQDGGAPVTDVDPVTQIRRLAMWDDASVKLVQSNHPDLKQIFGDRDLDNQADEGFREMLGLMDVVEVHPPAGILNKPQQPSPGRNDRQVIFRWLQLLNQGYRIPGVVNTDAHYNFHGSGWLRNYIACSTDEPDQIEPLEIVRQSEAGHVVMSTGPFMTVEAVSGEGPHPRALPGDDLTAPQGKLTLKVRVQCPNWLDINRVQVFRNGRPVDTLNITRRDGSRYFSDDVVKFEAELPVTLEEDAHLIVVAAGEGLKLGRVMGPEFGEQMPIAVANPIFVDVDGNGFKANGDLLDLPLPGAPSASPEKQDKQDDSGP